MSERDRKRRALSQNFLRTPAVHRYLSLLDVDAEALVLEVGAGDGAITDKLAPKCRELRANEIDPYHAHKLKERVRRHGNVRVLALDFLATRPPMEPFTVVGNVPFSITSKVVEWCIDAPTLTAATIITQFEYAKKRAGSYGRWSLRTVQTWPWLSWELRGRISRQDFRPVPRVDAGVLHIGRRDRPLIPQRNRKAYIEMVSLGFSGIGGSLYRSLIRLYPANRVAAAFEGAGVASELVVAYVNPEQWVNIFRSMHR